MSEADGAVELGAEMGGAEFGDARLAKRLAKIVGTLVEGPGRSFPSIFDDTALEGAYRFFNNGEVTPERILAPHVEATVARMACEATALVVHDTSTMSFDPDGARRGLGRVRSAGQAFFAHVSIALNGDGRNRAEVEAAGRPRGGGHRVRPGESVERLAGAGEREDLAGRRPPAEPGIRVAPVGKPAAGVAVPLRHIHLGRPVAPACPGHEGAPGSQPRMADLGPVSGNTPGPAAGSGGEPDVILGHESDQVATNMRKSKIPG